MCPDRLFMIACPHSQRGVGLPMALFIMVVLSLIAVSISYLSEDAGKRFGLEINSMRAFYAAESGAQVAVHRRIPPTGAPAACTANMVSLNLTATGVAGCSVSVDCAATTVGTTTYSTITSTGVCGSLQDEARRMVQVRIK